MAKDDRHIIDMTLEGEFTAPPPPPGPPLGARIMLWAIVAVVLCVAVLIVALTFWFVLLIMPLAMLAALIGFLAIRYQIWRHGQSIIVRRGPGR
jgi:hypothetical protein